MTVVAGDGAAPDTTALRTEVRELTAAWAAEGRYEPISESWLRSFDLEFSRELAARGLVGMTYPTRLGGAGRTYTERLVVTEELLRAGAPVAAHSIGDRRIGPAVLRHGTAALQEEFVPRIASVDVIFCLGMCEPDTGSDLAAVRTSAVRAEGGWRINGRKIWTSQGHKATHAYLLARTDRGEWKHQGLTEFVADLAQPGICVSPIVDMMGEHHFNEVVFEDVFVPGHYVIGEVSAGWRQVTEQLAFERGGPERLLSSYPMLVDILFDTAGHLRCQDEGAVAEIGFLAARLATLRRLCYQVAVS